MHHKIVINFKGVMNEKIIEIYKINFAHDSDFPPLYRYNIINEYDYWFILYDETNNSIIAECSVIAENYNVFEINDVYVIEKYRGNNYSTLLIMNVLLYFDTEYFYINKLSIKICANIDNIEAVTCYQKIFGDPYRTDNKYTYFAI